MRSAPTDGELSLTQIRVGLTVGPQARNILDQKVQALQQGRAPPREQGGLVKLRETQLVLAPSLSCDLALFNHLAIPLTSLYDAHLRDIETDYVSKVAVIIDARRPESPRSVSPQVNNRDVTVALVTTGMDCTSMAREPLFERAVGLLDQHVAALCWLADLRGWSQQPLLSAQHAIVRSRFRLHEEHAKSAPRTKDYRARMVRHLDLEQAFIELQVVAAGDGEVLGRERCDVPSEWRELGARSDKIVWTSSSRVELRPRRRLDLDVGPTLVLEWDGNHWSGGAYRRDLNQ